jgi:hypothetical protein
MCASRNRGGNDSAARYYEFPAIKAWKFHCMEFLAPLVLVNEPSQVNCGWSDKTDLQLVRLPASHYTNVADNLAARSSYNVLPWYL